MTDNNMPKFTQPLTKNGLILFIANYEFWAKNKKLNDTATRINLPLAMQNDVAQQWFLINKSIVLDNSIDWNSFIKKFTAQCPMDGEDDNLGVLEILGKKQEQGKKASLFIQNVRYLMGKNWNNYKEEDLIQNMIKQLVIPLRRYIECRGSPSNYDHLVDLIQEYEVKGGPYEEEMVIKKEIGVNWAETSASTSFEL